jgi:hypothetical protein
VPTQEVAVHARLPTAAWLTVILNVTQSTTALSSGGFAQCDMWALVVPEYTAPARVKLTANGWDPNPAETTTAHGHWVVVSCRSLWKPMQSRAYVELRDKWAQGGPPH